MANKSKKVGRPRKTCISTRLKKSCARHSRCSWRKGTGCVRKPSKRSARKRSKSRRKSQRKSRRKSRKSVSKLKKKILYAFTNDYDKNTFIYTYAKKIPAKDASEVIKAIKKAMKGFLNVIVKHIKDNKYELSTTGPDQNTTNELKNLAQLGEYTKYTVKMAKGYNWWV